MLAPADPLHGHADHGTADDRQIHEGIDFSDSASVLTRDDIEPEVKAGFNPPVPPVGLEHLLGVHLGGRVGTDQILGFDFLGRFAVAIDATGQSSGLLGKREIDPGGRSVKSNEAARFEAAAVELTGLDEGRLVPRGKMRPRGWCRVVARWRRYRAGCL